MSLNVSNMSHQKAMSLRCCLKIQMCLLSYLLLWIMSFHCFGIVIFIFVRNYLIIFGILHIYTYIHILYIYIYGTLNNLGNISNKACMLISENSRSMFFFLLFMKSNFVFMPQQETNHHLYLSTLTKDKTCLFERSEAADNDCWGRELSFNN